MSKFPKDWVKYKFESLKDPSDRYSITGGPFGSDLMNKDYQEGGVRVIQLQNIGDGNFIDDSKIYTSIEKADSLKSCNIYPGDIILSKMGDPVARACIIPNSKGRYLMCSDGIRLSVDKLKFDTSYAYYFINSNFVREEAELVSTGTTRKRIGLTSLKEIDFYAPDLGEQKKIAEILTSVDKVIELTEIEIEKLKNLKQGMMQDLLTKGIGHTKFKDSPIGKIPESWKFVSLGEVSTKMTNGFVGTATPYYTSQKEGVPYIRGLNVRPNRFDGRNLIYITKEFHEKQSRTILKKGDLLTVQSGHNGQTCVVPKEYEGANLHAVILTTLDKKKCNPYFISYFINSDEGMSKIDNILTGSTVKHINVKDFKNFVIPLPSLKEQVEISEKLDSIQTVINIKNLKLQKNKEIKKGLMQDLLTGKVRVNV